MRFATRSLALILVALAAVSAAGASSFPGKNGKLIYTQSGKAPDHLVVSNADGSSPKRLTSPPPHTWDNSPR